MQATTEAAAAAFVAAKAPLAEPELEPNLKCPRCESTNTKFCYYNNYNLSQPRHFCKDCRRYWTKGGSLRNVPVGGGTRKNSKRSSAAVAESSNPKRLLPASADAAADEFPNPDFLSVSFTPVEDENRLLDISGSFGSLLSSTAQFGSFFEFYHFLDSMLFLRDVNRSLSEPKPQSSADSRDGNCGGASAQPAPIVGDTSSGAGGWPQSCADRSGGSCGGASAQPPPLVASTDTSSWAGGWPDFSIYNPSSSFQLEGGTRE